MVNYCKYLFFSFHIHVEHKKTALGVKMGMSIHQNDSKYQNKYYNMLITLKTADVKNGGK